MRRGTDRESSISQTNTNNFGAGARFGYRIHRNLMMEGELAYDHGINFEEAYRNVENGQHYSD